MAVMTTAADRSELTVDDLDAMPDDGFRRELLDGSLIVTPPPRVLHQRVSQRLTALLVRHCPPDLEVLYAPVGVRVSESTSLEPDLLVTRPGDLGEMNLPVAPLLAVEILSPSTRHIDLGLKKRAYEALGAPSYWVLDPAVPSIIAWELVDGAYVEAGRAEGDDEVLLEQPFGVRIVPAELVP